MCPARFLKQWLAMGWRWGTRPFQHMKRILGRRKRLRVRPLFAWEESKNLQPSEACSFQDSAFTEPMQGDKRCGEGGTNHRLSVTHEEETISTILEAALDSEGQTTARTLDRLEPASSYRAPRHLNSRSAIVEAGTSSPE